MRDADIRVLTELGLNKSEAIIYLDLVRNPPSVPAEIAKRVKFHRPNVYDALNRLKEIGLVTISLSGKSKRFKALDPSKLKLYLKQKESELDDLIEDLKKIPRSKGPDKEGVSMYRGIAIRKELFSLMDNKDTIYVSVHPSANLLGSKFLEELDEIRIKRKVPMKLLFSAKNTDIFKHWKRKNLEVRYFTAFNDAFGVITIIKGNNLYYIVKGNEMSMIKITNKEIVGERKMHFEHAWKMCSFVV